MKIQSVQQLMTTAMTYTLDMEDKLAAAAPTMADASFDPDLKELFSKTATKSKDYASKVEQAFTAIGEKVQRNDNHITDAMIKEVEEMIKNTDSGPVRDSALIVAANQQQLFRVASYGSLASYAKTIGKQDAVKGITESLEDSKNGDKKFTELAESKINVAAAKAGEQAMQTA
jgi:ferritin-like metal-binding protein YciE